LFVLQGKHWLKTLVSSLLLECDLRNFIYTRVLLFENIWFVFQAGLTQKWEAAGMSSVEGEYVEFGHAVYLDGPVEVSSQFNF
jgi:hypothetical protein